MEPDLGWLLIGLPVAFALGWLASRLDLRQLRRARDDSPRTYYKGLNLLLNEQQDQAIDAFIQELQGDPESTELHFALGNLFRRRGDFGRAVRVHRHLLERADLKADERERAQRALAQDYMKAGLFDRAETAWTALRGSRYDDEAQLALLSLYERSRGWQQAAEVARRLQGRLDGDDRGRFAARIAHYECELCQEADVAGQPEAATAALERARLAAPDAARPGVLAGQRLRRAGDHAGAVAAWEALRQRDAAAFLLVARDYADSAAAAGQAESARRLLAAEQARQPALELLQALEHLDADRPAAERLPRLLEHLRAQPTLAAARLLLSLPEAEPGADQAEARAVLNAAIARAARPLERYRCSSCGFEAQQHFWQCPGCLAWDSFSPHRQDAT